jgi:hypothetical protein
MVQEEDKVTIAWFLALYVLSGLHYLLCYAMPIVNADKLYDLVFPLYGIIYRTFVQQL